MRLFFGGGMSQTGEVRHVPDEIHQTFSRRSFIAKTSCFGALYGLARAIPLPAMVTRVAADSRVSQRPLADKGFASVRKIGDGLYATISDPSKGYTTLCNGGFIVGKDAALLVEGFAGPAGASFQMDVLRTVTQAPVRGAVDTHYHFDHSMGNAYYGANNIPVWAHSKVPGLMSQNYSALQAGDRAAFLAPIEKRVRDAKSDLQRQHAQTDLAAATGMYETVHANLVAVPNRLLDPAKLPEKVDLGGVTAVLETYPGHTPGDVVVRVPEQNVIYTGDLLFNGWYPVTFDATISGWRSTLAKFAGFGKDTLFVPGHGQICGQEGITTIREVFDDIAAQAEKMYKAGVPVEEAADRYVVPEKFKNFPIFAWGFTIGPTITKLYAEWQAK
jgi:glyoxylase-like metal-dependent hydrolase (beta-lactamase superfamily II)